MHKVILICVLLHFICYVAASVYFPLTTKDKLIPLKRLARSPNSNCPQCQGFFPFPRGFGPLPSPPHPHPHPHPPPPPPPYGRNNEGCHGFPGSYNFGSNRHAGAERIGNNFKDVPSAALTSPEEHNGSAKATASATADATSQSGGGSASSNASASAKATSVANQNKGDKVRLLKSSGTDKSVWEPEVKTLLNLKKQLEEAQKGVTAVPQSVQNAKVDPNEAKRLEEEVAKQGDVVRKLKESGAEKSVWQPEVNKLLSLKNDLAKASGTPLAATQKSKKSKK